MATRCCTSVTFPVSGAPEVRYIGSIENSKFIHIRVLEARHIGNQVESRLTSIYLAFETGYHLI
ncbi:MAG: hypothetical protein AAF573_21225 [Bacteroidota bacterium]